MTRAAWLAAGGVAAAMTIAAFAVVERVPGPRPPAERPPLALLTSLPLVFGERFALEGGGSPALTRLEQRYRVQPIALADAASLKGHELFLMAHPRAQPAEALVDLDRWVRGGGRVLLLADPKLDWDSGRPLGDNLRPPPAFADTGLLSHWGLALQGAAPDETHGRLISDGRCQTEEDGMLARCPIGRGSATVIADADFLDAGTADADGLDPLIIELDRLETR